MDATKFAELMIKKKLWAELIKFLDSVLPDDDITLCCARAQGMLGG